MKVNKQKKDRWIWKYQKIDPDLTWEDYKTKYWTKTWSGQITYESGNIKL